MLQGTDKNEESDSAELTFFFFFCIIVIGFLTGHGKTG